MRLQVLGQLHELGDPSHLWDNEAEGEGVFAQRAVSLCLQDTIDELQAEGEAVVVVLVEADRQVDRRIDVISAN